MQSMDGASDIDGNASIEAIQDEPWPGDLELLRLRQAQDGHRSPRAVAVDDEVHVLHGTTEEAAPGLATAVEHEWLMDARDAMAYPIVEHQLHAVALEQHDRSFISREIREIAGSLHLGDTQAPEPVRRIAVDGQLCRNAPVVLPALTGVIVAGEAPDAPGRSQFHAFISAGMISVDFTCLVKYGQVVPEPLPHVAPYARIKRHVVERIEAGQWAIASRVPSENQLAAEFKVSRMTARRALLELTHEGWLVRSQGLGTFVADRKPALSILEVRNIAEEIIERGHCYSNQVLRLEAEAADESIAMNLGLNNGARVFHSIIVHIENEIPVQLEDRYTNPAVARDYLAQEFKHETPNAYLSRLAPIEAIEHTIEAVLPAAHVAGWLQISTAEPCLQINRRTWSAGRVASYARLVHPGTRYRMGGYLSVARTARRLGNRG